MLQEFGQEIADQYIEIILMDTICRNADRHTYNYGVLRDQNTGKVVSLAPNFDNNIALVSSGYDDSPRQNDLLIDLFNEFEQETHAVSDYLTRHKMPVITKEMIYACCDATGIEIDKEYILQFVNAGYNNILALR